MKNKNKWQPSKYVYKTGKLIASRSPEEVNAGSTLMADLVAEFYNYSLRRYAKGRLLDLGCGKVPLYIAYKDLITDNICVDWSNTLHKNEYLDYELDLTKPLPFSDGEFDTIILSDVLEHLPQPQLLWDEMSRLLSNNGTIVANVPFYYWIHEQPHDYYRYTEFALRNFVENAGLKLIQIKSLGGVPEILADICSKCIQRIPLVGQSLARFIQWLTMLIIRMKGGKKISEATRNIFPIGYSFIVQKIC